MDFLDELEAMAQAPCHAQQCTSQIHPDTIQRWCHLFGYNIAKATKEIEAYRTNLSQCFISDSHWDLIRDEKKAQGHDKESYAYSTSLLREKHQPKERSGHLPTSEYLFKLETPLGDIAALMKIIGTSNTPNIFHGTDETSKPVTFCQVDSAMKWQIEKFLLGKSTQPTFVPFSLAEKDLSSFSRFPTLGIDTTLPQHRPIGGQSFYPAQNDYPVWFFFYGTLKHKDILAGLVGTEPCYVPAKTYGGKLDTWGGKYWALKDDLEGSAVQGNAVLIENKDQENALRLYETNKYEIVRCQISMAGRTVDGLTFRFVGQTD
ncbi:hypothetical protein G7046_g8333 [Stylonectria norvegica]|nr:hypothetical protein G7046_g8333 [Stylonectria norvegica]